MNSSQHARFEIVVHKTRGKSYWTGGGGGWISQRLSRRQWHLTIVYKYRL